MSVERLLKRYQLTGDIQPRPQGVSHESELNGYSSQLHELVKKYPDSTLSEYCDTGEILVGRKLAIAPY